MPYWIRVLLPSEGHVPVTQLRERLGSEGIAADIQVDDEDQAWDQILLSHQDDTPIAMIERDSIPPDEFETSELPDFAEQIEGEKPDSAARWLCAYLPQVRVIYAFQILSGADRDEGWASIHAVQGELWGTLGGILQADSEGFTNEAGHHILWEFADSVDGPWQTAILADDGQWSAFEMDLGNPRHRSAFLAGRIPDGVSTL